MLPLLVIMAIYFGSRVFGDGNFDDEAIVLLLMTAVMELSFLNDKMRAAIHGS